MSDSLVTFYVLALLALLALWIGVAIAVGKAAAKKNRRRWLWMLLSLSVLGPVGAPLWLASMPVVGAKGHHRSAYWARCLDLFSCA